MNIIFFKRCHKAPQYDLSCLTTFNIHRNRHKYLDPKKAFICLGWKSNSDSLQKHALTNRSWMSSIAWNMLINKCENSKKVEELSLYSFEIEIQMAQSKVSSYYYSSWHLWLPPFPHLAPSRAHTWHHPAPTLGTIPRPWLFSRETIFI